MPKSSPEKLAAALRANLKKRKSPGPSPAADLAQSRPGESPAKPAEIAPEPSESREKHAR
jgi:hypothetical protein